MRARITERAAVRAARMLITNSERTRNHLIHALGVSPDKAHTAYLGIGEEYSIVTDEERNKARADLHLLDGQTVALFVGALSYDTNKGIDTLLEAWSRLSREPTWDGVLLVVGDGNGRALWQRSALAKGVRFLGYSTRVHTLLAAADVLVSPVRYEAFGMNVYEALCRGVPVIVSENAGVAELMPAYLSSMLLRNPNDPAELAQALLSTRAEHSDAKRRVHRWRQETRVADWDAMAASMVALIRAGENDAGALARPPVDRSGS